MIHDPIADMLTRIRNGGRARLLRVKMPKSKLKVEVARALRERGYIAGYSDDPDAAKPTLCVEIRYGDDDRPVIEGIQRVSSPGRRVYVRANRIPHPSSPCRASSDSRRSACPPWFSSRRTGRPQPTSVTCSTSSR